MHTDSGRDTMKHMCDTEGGSSGAPLIDKERGFAVGLHWGGKPNETNYAISMRMILEDIEANCADTYAQLSVAE
jgi:V8-like Glu-specific endopeptidase